MLDTSSAVLIRRSPSSSDASACSEMKSRSAASQSRESAVSGRFRAGFQSPAFHTRPTASDFRDLSVLRGRLAIGPGT